jgi:5-methyltetrahydrofolate--homocysteine methyltransferase
MQEYARGDSLMIVIGEKINGAIPRAAEAITSRDSEYIRSLVQAQESCGADYLDICAGTTSSEEYEALCWLIDVVQNVSIKPICIDSPNPEVLKQVLPKIAQPGLVNSISMEGNKCDVLLPVLKENPEWGVVALACDNSGIAEKAENKTAIALALIEKAATYDVMPDRIYLDPLVLALSTVETSAIEFTEAIKMIKRKHPTIKVTAAVSNISYGMPARRIINSIFLAMCIESGLDSVIVDPTNRSIIETIYGTEALIGKDCQGRKYNRAFRSGKIGSIK